MASHVDNRRERPAATRGPRSATLGRVTFFAGGSGFPDRVVCHREPSGRSDGVNVVVWFDPVPQIAYKHTLRHTLT